MPPPSSQSSPGSPENTSAGKRARVVKLALAQRGELLAYARALLGNHAAAEDAVQEALLVVVKKFDQFAEGTSILAWCRSIVRLEVLRAKQRQQRQRSLAERLLEDAVDAAFVEFQEDRRHNEGEPRREALSQCLQELTRRNRLVLHARFVDELSYQHIGDRVGMTLEAVRKALYRVKRQVRACVESKLRLTR